MPEESPATTSRLEPSIEVPEIQIDVDSVASLGEALGIEAEDIKTAGEQIKEHLKNPESGDKFGRSTNNTFGVDPRQETLHKLATDHSADMETMNKFVDNVHTSIASLQAITKAITAHYANEDELNGASLSEVQDIIDAQQQSPEV